MNKELIKARIRLAFIVLLGVVIGASYLYAYQQYLDVRHGFDIVKEYPAVVSAEAEDSLLGGGEGSDALLLSLGEIREKIFSLESTNGKYVNCPEGTYNGYGYAQNKQTWQCYETQEEVDTLVEDWFEDKLSQGMSLDTALCYYNEGKIMDSCDYSVKYHNLNK